MFEKISDFWLYQFRSPGYTPIETLTYAAALIIFAYLIFKIKERLGISADKRLALSIAPYIVLGGLLRVLKDLEILTYPFLITPWIYFFIFFLLAAALAISLLLEIKFRIPYFKTLFFIGILLLLLPASFIRPTNLYGIALVAILFAPWLIAFELVRWRAENKIVTLLHVFDGTTTSTAISFFGYAEQHWLPSIAISSFGPFSFILVKFFAIVALLISIDRLCKDRELRNYIKLLIGILAAATSTRDLACLATLCTPH